MRFETQDNDACLLIRVTEKELRFDLSEEFKRIVFAMLEEADKSLIISIKNVEFLDSTALSTFVAAHNRLTSKGHDFALCGVCSKVMNVLKLTSLDRHLQVIPSESEALTILSCDK